MSNVCDPVTRRKSSEKVKFDHLRVMPQIWSDFQVLPLCQYNSRQARLFCGSVSTFDVMMQGFYRESHGRSESVAQYVARLEGKLNEI